MANDYVELLQCIIFGKIEMKHTHFAIAPLRSSHEEQT